ncbi:hypothetical protein JMN32_14945 [Fulvivirga sp. 29W222]|uniref:Uncharacterized protein n=1 Tax=Fulvivirga marina TaxID=2494733 RepID=A0A937FZ21_9BACT|nr:hypothetical protein [Fulvivirga marina]MBL6447613.1 hypothetical protein [Fulvivirga marina]
MIIKKFTMNAIIITLGTVLIVAITLIYSLKLVLESDSDIDVRMKASDAEFIINKKDRR